jgi:hypothetical protein
LVLFELWIADLTKSPRMANGSIVPSGLFDAQQDWRPDYEQWQRSRVCFVDDIRGVKDGSKYEGLPNIQELERVWAKL